MEEQMEGNKESKEPRFRNLARPKLVAECPCFPPEHPRSKALEIFQVRLRESSPYRPQRSLSL